MIKTLVLTSTQNFSWTSMQEIIPFIANSWKDINPDEVKIVDVDQTSLQDYLPQTLSVDNIVLTCFTPKLYKVAHTLRALLSHPARFIVHLHNQSTIACWPMRHWGGKDLFRKKDIFVSSCSRDAECLRNTFPEAECTVIPFSYKELPNLISRPEPELDVIPFVFIGRLSSQKNLHTLLLSLSHLKFNWSLDLIGKEDGLGSPNMGMKDHNYELFLREIARDLGVTDRIHFHGFQNRNWIQSQLEKRRYIFAAPSLHADENFGMAAFQSLIKGHLCVLSDWGGHTDFKTYFPEQVFLCPVYKTPRGPYINPREYAEVLSNSAKMYKTNFLTTVPSYYSYGSILVKNSELLKNTPESSETLKVSLLAETILGKISAIPGQQDQHIFQSYLDPQAHIFFASYGMKSSIIEPHDFSERVPWLKTEGTIALVQDPHRGFFTVDPTSTDELQKNGYIY